MKTSNNAYSLTAYVTRHLGGHYTYQLGMSGAQRAANDRADAIARASRLSGDLRLGGVTHTAKVARVVIVEDRGATGGCTFLSAGLPAYAVNYHVPTSPRPEKTETVEVGPVNGRLLP